MNLGDVATLLLGLGVGGVAGALATFVLSGNKLLTSLQLFGAKLNGFLAAHQQDPEARELSGAFEMLKADLQRALQAVLNLKRMLRWK